MEDHGFDPADIEDAVDKWADRAVQEAMDAKALEADADKRKLDYRFGGFMSVADYRKADGVILPTPDGVLAFELHIPTQNRLAELALVVRWAINNRFITLRSFQAQPWQDVYEVAAQSTLEASYG